jgi:hypothetical protein
MLDAVLHLASAVGVGLGLGLGRVFGFVGLGAILKVGG